MACMNLETLVEQLPTIRAEAKRWREQEAEARRKAEGYEEIIRGLENVIGAPPVVEASAPEPEVVKDTNGTGSLRGIGAVRKVMLEHPERAWAARDIHTVMESRQWISPKAQHPLRGTEAAINRLMHRGEIEKVRPGRYRVTDQMRRDED